MFQPRFAVPGGGRARLFARPDNRPDFRLDGPQALLNSQGMHSQDPRLGIFSRGLQLLDLLLNLVCPPARLRMQTQQILQIRVRARNGGTPQAFEFVFSSHDCEG